MGSRECLSLPKENQFFGEVYKKKEILNKEKEFENLKNQLMEEFRNMKNSFFAEFKALKNKFFRNIIF